MLSKLWFRFTIIGLIMAVCATILAVLPLKKGTDLAGGVDLLYELDLSSLRGSNINSKDVANHLIAVLKRRIDPNGLKNLTWRVVGDDRIEIQMPLATEATRAARAKYQEAENALTASNMQKTALELALGEPDPAARAIAMDKLAAKGTTQRQALDDLTKASDDYQQKQAAAQKLVADGKEPDGDQLAALNAAKDLYDRQLAQLLNSNVNVDHVRELMSDMEDPTDKKARAEFDAYRARPEFANRAALFQALMDAHLNLVANNSGGFDDPEQLKRELRGKGVLEFRIGVLPSDDGGAMAGTVQQAVTQLKDVGPRKVRLPNMAWFEVDKKNAADMAKQADWPDNRGNVVIHYPAPQLKADKSGPDWESTPAYILLYTDRAHVLDHSDMFSQWALTRASVGNENGQPVVYFSFDPIGAGYFATLTGTNTGRPMAIVLDDKAISAPRINSAIPNGSGVITLGGDQGAAKVKEEADQLVRMLDAGSLPAALKPDPVSENKISSTLGADNIRKGLSSSFYAIIAVAIFMIVYYSLTGLFANLAVIVNLVMLLAAMSAFQASLTLPGIAGIVLTLGMAVDSNVLINERIREEVHRGASLWMAVRQGYDKVFWTIFDAHITTSLTSIVLIFIDQVGQFTGLGSGGGANEVKGFGVTLLIGLMCSMFTALFVTRTLMVASVKWGILRQIDSTDPVHWINDIVTLQFLKGKWPFLKMLTVANIDWMGKKYYFWAFSATITVLGMSAFFYRGSDKYDTEFNGGTQVTMKLTAPAGGALPDIAKVRQMVNHDMLDILDKKQLQAQADAADARKNDADRKTAAALAESFKTMKDETEQANVLEVGEGHNQFQVVSTVAGTRSKDFIQALAEEFHDYMSIKPGLRFTGFQVVDPTRQEGAQPDAMTGVIHTVKGELLSQTFPGATAPETLLNNVPREFVNGLAIDLDNITPPQAAKDIADRIAIANKGAGGNAAFWKTRLIPIAFADGKPVTDKTTPWETRPATHCVLLVMDDNTTSKDGSDWITSVALPQWHLVQQALVEASPIDGSVASFDAAVADAAKAQAVIAMCMSLCLVVIYVWIRFGSIKYGIGAILSLAHDALMAVAGTVLAGLIYMHMRPVADALLITDFKINLTMIAAYLTIVGYSVNDTIVIFDRIRENRGRGMAPLTTKLVNDSINQCFGRTIWTTFTVFIVVLILYIWGGEGVRGFSFAMLIGVFTGAYSTLAIASPALLSLRDQLKHAPPLPPSDVETSTDLATRG